MSLTRDQLDTPCLCIELDTLDRNARSVLSTCRANGVAWRPHAKCHKSAAIGRRLIDMGALGLTCARLDEAERMAAAGIRDLLIANMIVGPGKMTRLVELRKIADPILCFDNIVQAHAVSQAMVDSSLSIRALVEVDIGLNRVGVAAGETTLELAQQVAQLPGIQFAGLMGYEGHLLRIADLDDKAARIAAALQRLTDTHERVLAAGLPAPIVSCGGTGSYTFSAARPGITEIQAGGAIFMDEFYRHDCQVQNLEVSLTLLTTVVSRPTADRVVVDAGRKSQNAELRPPRVLGWEESLVLDYLSAEHGVFRLTEPGPRPSVGERLELVLGYSDWSTILHRQYHVCRGDQVIDTWSAG